MIRVMLLLGATASVLVLASVATAAPPTHTSQTLQLSGNPTYCNFNLHVVETIQNDLTYFSDGSIGVHDRLSGTFTNVDTGYVLTGDASINGTQSRGRPTDNGLILRLRDASGKVVAVIAGAIAYDSSNQVVSFTPNATGDLQADICTALGGSKV